MRACWRSAEALGAEALAEAGDDEPLPPEPGARRPPGQRLLAAIFGNSPFLTGVAVREWAFLTQLVKDGADAAFDDLISEAKQAD